MKHLNYLLLVVLGITLVACKKDKVDPEESSITIFNNTNTMWGARTYSDCASLVLEDPYDYNKHQYIGPKKSITLTNTCGGTQTVIVEDIRTSPSRFVKTTYTLSPGDHVTHYLTKE